MMRLRGRTVVITGASSGIGRATALAFAHCGCRLALSARREDVLKEVAERCAQAGGKAIAVPTDVIDSEAVHDLARRAEHAFGGIDVWVNNAGTGVFGPYTEVPFAFHRRTIEVDLLGAMHGAYAVLPLFMRQGYGTLINNISIGAWCPTPYTAAYTASKFGLRGFTASLRQELMEWPDIHVCSVFPSMIDTPGFDHGANFSGHRIGTGPFIYAPEEVADVIVGLAVNPQDEVAVGWPARAAQIAYTVARRPTEWVVATAMRLLLRRTGPAHPSEGALMHPLPKGTTASGGWRRRYAVPSATIMTRIGLAAIVGTALLLGVGSANRRS
ncbi:MAG: short-chain dehydrogenase [Nitrospira sp. SG-bin1]|nr:MAG: short-chain dehydrogenase [Nitrospira sp. SG-bin1]